MRTPNTAGRLLGAALTVASLAACGPTTKGESAPPSPDPVIEAAKHPTTPPEAAPYDAKAGKHNLGLGQIVCSHLQVEYTKGEREIGVAAIVRPMPEDMILKITVQSSRPDYDVARQGSDLTIEGDVVSTTIDASSVGIHALGSVIIAFPTANGHYGGAECPPDGV